MPSQNKGHRHKSIHYFQVGTVILYGIPIVSLIIEAQERLCLAQISNTLLKQFSYNEIHNRRVALGESDDSLEEFSVWSEEFVMGLFLGITCVQCTPVQLEILRRAGAMPVSSRRCGMITRREAERLCKSFLGDNAPPRYGKSGTDRSGKLMGTLLQTAGRLRVRCASRVRLGMPRVLPALAVQLLEGEVHQVPSLRTVLLAEQVHIPLPPPEPLRQVRPAGRGQLQLLEAAYEALRQPFGRHHPRLGGREGDVQRRNAQTPPPDLHRAEVQQADEGRAGDPPGRLRADHPSAAAAELLGHPAADLEGRDGLHVQQTLRPVAVLHPAVAEEEPDHLLPAEPVLLHRQELPVRFQASVSVKC